MLRENERELTTIDQARLAYVDHTPDVRAYAKGAKLLLAKRQLPHRVTTAAGTDVTGLLDGSNDGYFVGEPGETLTVELIASGIQAPPASSGVGGGEDLDPFEIDPGDKDGGGGAGSPGLYSISPGETSSDAVVLATTGILVQGMDPSGNWTTVRKVYPRKEFAEVLVDTLDQGPVRLVFVGRHKVRYVGRLIPAGSEITPSLMDLTSAAHTRLGNVRSALAGSGDATSSLAPGDSIVLEYEAPPVATGSVRDFFLLARGSYRAAPFIAEERTDLPRRFALIQNRPNPFQARTAIRFQIPSGNIVRIDILDAQGRRLETLANRFFPAGEHSVEWIPRESRSKIGPGVYFYQVRAGLFRDQKQMVLVP